ncbi:MAG: hypothetical protein H7211_15810 [Aquabacterium sp.]|nr:hypothetical protein [Ferruginibacter sp.]
MKNILLATGFLMLLIGCKKQPEINAVEIIALPASYTNYTILQGQYYCDKSTPKLFAATKMSFKIKFDSSAIYQTVDPVNQYDINKLFGFSEGDNHHLNSARLCWAWHINALHLYGYVYSDSIRAMKEIARVNIGAELICSVAVTSGGYVFTVNDTSHVMPRLIKGVPLAGYWLYPYFGGDETALTIS